MPKVKRFYAPGLDGLWRDPAGAPRELIPLVLEKDYDALLVENKQLRAREKECPSMSQAQSRALLRGLQEIASVLDLNNPSPADLVAAVEHLHTRAGELAEQLHTAHAFVENTEAFGLAARSGILQCGDVVWNITQSKKLLGLPAQAPQEQEE